MIYLAHNLKYLRGVKTLSQQQLADMLEIKKSRLGAYEEERAEPPLSILKKIADNFKIPIDGLVSVDLSKSADTNYMNIGNNRTLFPIVIDSDEKDQIEVISQKARAGYLSGYNDPEYIKDLPKLSLPFMPVGKHRAFPILGDSMPPLQDGAYVVGRFVESVGEVKSGKTYVIVTNDDGVVYKRVFRSDDQPSMLMLHSDNSIYEPFEVHLKDVIEIWEFTCSINTSEYNAKIPNQSNIVKLLDELRSELG